MTTSNLSSNDSEQKRIQICLELGVRADTSWEDLCCEIENIDWRRQQAISLGLPPNSSTETISRALQEQTRRKRLERLGLPTDASTEQIMEAEREEERVEQATERGLPASSTWQEIAESLWQERNSPAGTIVETGDNTENSTTLSGQLTLIILACGLLLLAPIPVAFPLRLCFTGAAFFIARRILRYR